MVLPHEIRETALPGIKAKIALQLDAITARDDIPPDDRALALLTQVAWRAAFDDKPLAPAVRALLSLEPPRDFKTFGYGTYDGETEESYKLRGRIECYQEGLERAVHLGWSIRAIDQQRQPPASFDELAIALGRMVKESVDT
jgi:hypothetical protein